MMRARLSPLAPANALTISSPSLPVNKVLVGECNLKRGESALLQEGSIVVFGSQGHREHTDNPHVMEVRGSESRAPRRSPTR